MIKAIIFDCFGVLTGDKWIEFVGTLPEVQRHPARSLNHARDAGLLLKEDFIREIQDLTGRQPEDVEEATAKSIVEHKNDKLLEYIAGLKPQYKIGLISNISSDWILSSFLTKTEAALFDDTVFSYLIGVTKPDPHIFEVAAERLRVEPAECIFIDDVEGNCAGARAVGMQAIWYTDFVQMKQALEKLLGTDSKN